jgi:hypothetical protein
MYNSIGSESDPLTVSLEHNTEPSDPLKGEELCNHFTASQFIMMASVVVHRSSVAISKFCEAL